jgi:alkylation response protein AidB-like acyl-CoA dehydrogenase
MTVDFTLSDEQRNLRDAARTFAEEELAPASRAIREDGFDDSPYEQCRETVAEGADRGFMTMLVPERYGGGGNSLVDLSIAMEEFAAVDLGLTITYFNNTATAAEIINAGGTDEQKERLFGELCSLDVPLLTGARNEPGVAGSDFFCPSPDPDIGIETYAERDGDEYVINGEKVQFCANAGIAEYYFIVARTDLDVPMRESLSIFVVPAGAEGLSTGDRTELLGWDTSHNASVTLDDVRVPEANLLGREEGAAGRFLPQALPYITTGFGACYVGLARAAYEQAREYASQRESWGEPIENHQAVALKLADMYVNVETARTLVWNAADAIDSGDPDAGIKAPAAKTHAVDAAIENAETAVKLMGGLGVTADSPAAEYLRDAWTGFPVDGTRDMMRLGLFRQLQRRGDERT